MSTTNLELQIKSQRALTLGSGCKLGFLKRKINNNSQQQEKIIPILILTGINQSGIDGMRVSSAAANGKVGIITSQVDNQQKIITSFIQNPVILNSLSDTSLGDITTSWLQLNPETDQIVYPRIFINSLQMKTNEDSVLLKYETYHKDQSSNNAINYRILKQYEDYSILTRSLQNQYVITLSPDVVIGEGTYGTFSGTIVPREAILNYSLSNADTSIYLDAVEVLKQNSMPKVSYEVKPNIYSTKYCKEIYNKLGNIIRINDQDLKFKNVRGYISGFTLDLDTPDNDSIEVKNYKTKFEDLFSTITAQTQQMKKNNGLFQAVSSAFTSTGDLSQEILQSSIMKVDLDYAFNNGKLTIDQHNGIWGISDNGVVAFRGGGIFTSTEKNNEGNWKWNTGITPEGINASLITTGQLDTNLIKIYSGDNLRFQMNGDGIFAYKSWLSDSKVNKQHPLLAAINQQIQTLENKDSLTEEQEEQLQELRKKVLDAEKSVDGKQYVLFNQNGLSLIAKKGAKVLNKNKTNYIQILNDNTSSLQQEIKRVQISWDGFILRNWQNEEVFYAEADTGNLVISGTINATGGHIGAWNFNGQKLWADTAAGDTGYTTFVALNAGAETELHKANGDLYPIIQQNFTTNAYCFWAGKPNPFEAPFSIKKNGELRATNGQIGGWTMEGGLFYNPASLVLAPQVLNGQGSITIPITITNENGETTSSTRTISYNNLILWVPSSTWRTKYNNGEATIWDSNGTEPTKFGSPSLTISSNGALTASSVNGCSTGWFGGYTLSYMYVSGHTLKAQTLNNDGSVHGTINFNGASGVKASIIQHKVLTDSSGNYNGIICKAQAYYPDGEALGSVATSTIYPGIKTNWGTPASTTSRQMRIYIDGHYATSVTVYYDATNGIT